MHSRVAKTDNHKTIAQMQQTPDTDNNQAGDVRLAIVESTPSRQRAPRSTPDKPYECCLCGDGFRVHD
jgi:hypothetical protein